MHQGQMTQAEVRTPALAGTCQKGRAKRAWHRVHKLALLASTAFAILSVQALAGVYIDTDVTVDGIDGGPYGKALSDPKFVSVGVKAPASLTISRGGTVTAPISNIGTNLRGTATITGAGSRWYGFDIMRVGWAGNGVVTIADHGSMSGKDMVLGVDSLVQGAVNLSGAGSKIELSGKLSLGVEGTGTLNLSDGGTVEAVSSVFGEGSGGSGTAIVSGSGTTWTSTGGLMVIGDAGRGVLTLADSANVVANDRVDIAKESGSTGMLNIGAAAGERATTAGTLQTGAIVFGAGDGSIVFNHTDTAYDFKASLTGTGTLKIMNGGTILSGDNSAFTGSTEISAGTLQIGNGGISGSLSGNITNNAALVFNRSDALTYAGVISGTGALTKSGTGTLTLTGANTHTGGTAVSAGRLVVNGSLGAVTLSGGTLGGSGTVGGFTANSGSTIAPGNSIGTLNVTGNADFAAGSTYEVEVDSAGNADKIVTTGGVSIDPNAKVNILAENGTDDGSTYAPSTTYTIITAGSAVNGKFGTVTDNFAFLDAALGYGDPKAVTLTLTRNAAPFASVGRTANQTAVANGVSSLTAGNGVFDAILGLSVDGARTAFDRLSGEIHPSVNGQLLEDSHLVRDAALARMFAPEEATGAWAQAYGNWEQSQGDGNASEMNRLLGETLFGADAIVWDGWRTGVVAGYGKTGFSAGNVASEADADSYILGGYASGAFGPVGVRLGTSYALHDVSTSRTAKAGGFSDVLTADYFAGTAQVFGEVGYRFETPQGHFEPYAGLALVNQHSAGFSETGGAAALTGSSLSHTIGVTSVGVRGMHEVSVGDDMTAALTGGVEWRHVIGDSSAQSAMNFAGGDAFTIAGTPMERDTFQLEAGLNLEFSEGATLDFGYQGALGSAHQSHGFTAKLSGTF